MSERDGFDFGVPCWVDTWQGDADAAARFYAEIFGWETDGGDGEPYMCRLRGRDVALIGRLPAADAHRPAAWLTHVRVEDVGETVQRIRDAGGSVPIGPIDSLERGRIAIVADPAGAHFGVWEQGEHRGAQLVNEAGAWSWAQLYTREPAAAPAFYASVFGWVPEPFGELTMFRLPGYVGGEPEQPVPRDVVAGMAPMGDELPAETPSHWRIDFWVKDVDAVVATAEELGGRAIVPAFDTEIFRQAVIADPAGAVFSVSRVTIGE
jgi:predicted enzyme related to lactoylglutathione lyase